MDTIRVNKQWADKDKHIWLPKGKSGDKSVDAVNKAVNEYDERLSFGRNLDTGDWCVYYDMPHGQDPFPIIGWREVPDPEFVLKKLYETDTVRNGQQMYEHILRVNNEQRRLNEKKSEEAAEESSELIEYIMRRHGESPLVKSLRPRTVKRNQYLGR